ncbi:helix-turn-helix domain-containing protein [Dubosiella newyorkensis]|uniref:helix-turn-helix domain-containing protein n=1 Tax=Dubosiella newyorkensis TaxID=1862672 RepID=UPI003F67BEFA
MAKRIQTTFEQRMEAVQWYEENGRSYKDTAAHFGYNYAQVRSKNTNRREKTVF